MLKIKKRLYKGTLSIIVVLVLAFFAKQYLNDITERELQKQKTWLEGKANATMVASDNKALQHFMGEFPAREIILACEEDITNDGLKDLLVIFREVGHVRLAAVCAKSDGTWTTTPPKPAPVENQTIRFKNIDKEAEVEFIISGEKNGAIGYAIFRMIDGEIIDLFGEGMEECC